jgi:hypothetical protein
MTMTPEEQAALATLHDRLRIILPEEYQDTYEDVLPVSMGSAALRLGADGQVAWDEMWESFCDLAMAGGPPHKGTLLEPATGAEVDAEPERYAQVVDEICRGVRLVTGLDVSRAPAPGWVRLRCLDEGMARWLLRAIVIENVSAHADGAALDLPAGPHFRLEKEIKNVVTVAAKTCHYWLGHTSRRKQQAIARLFSSMAQERPLVEPAIATDRVPGDDDDASTAAMAEAIQRATGWRRSNRRYAGWLGVECPAIHTAIWMMRALLVSNVLARREGTTLFAPVNRASDPDGATVVDALTLTQRLATLSPGVVPRM